MSQMAIQVRLRTPREEEGDAPAVADGEPRHDERREDGAEVGAGVEEAGREGALVTWEPFGDGFDGCGEVAGLAEAEGETRDGEAEDRGGEGVGHGGERPGADDDRVADARADFVDEPAGSHEANAIGELKGGNDVAVLALVPADDMLQRGCKNGENLAVGVIDGGGGEEQGADGPTGAAAAVSLREGLAIGMEERSQQQ